ncbi:hypothetical protein BHE74_00007120 [Ensete ventricosum]|nr:hypothetical protein GW17_00001505 [Ensete ventricosum]RWW84286.1 hypothetical protein BHE74_00007120 [Ensete ventricosum]RZS09243.1 hypothetical protein BHM03_00040304 [Ensete ventricosum]
MSATADCVFFFPTRCPVWLDDSDLTRRRRRQSPQQQQRLAPTQCPHRSISDKHKVSNGGPHVPHFHLDFDLSACRSS